MKWAASDDDESGKLASGLTAYAFHVVPASRRSRWCG